MSKKKQAYSENSIKHFDGLEGIRKRPSMYIGPIDSQGIYTITKECADNAADEFLAGRNKFVHIMQSTDKSIWVADHGSGIPVGKDKKSKLSTLTLVLTKTHAGGKFDAKAYSASIGTHGIGIKATNALSSFFEVYTFRDGNWWHTSFERGKEKTPVKKSKAPVLPHGNKIKKGTVIHFAPDTTIFNKGAKFEKEAVIEWCKLTAYLNAGFTTQFTDTVGKTKKWQFKNGVRDYIHHRIEDLKTKEIEGAKVFFLQEPNIDLAVAFTEYDGTVMEAYTNSSKNTDGGVHVNSFYSALVKAIEPYKQKGHKFNSFDLRDGIVGVINYKIDSPQFSSQTKEKLVDTRVTKPCEESVFKGLKEFFSKNKMLARGLCKKADAVRRHNLEFQKSKKLATNVKNAKLTISTKLAAVSGKAKPQDCELFLVEGDSAGGSAKVARDRDTQAVFPLKGKPLNVMEAPLDRIEANKEIASILAALGIDLSKENSIENMPYGKVVILSDADSDGKHITTLLLTVFWKFAPEMFERGMIYSAKPPEYVARYKGKTYFGSSKKSVLKKLQKKGATEKSNVEIKHLKGLGEMEAEDLKVTSFDYNTRRLYKIKPPKKKKGVLSLEQLMGKDTSYRKILMGVE